MAGGAEMQFNTKDSTTMARTEHAMRIGKQIKIVLLHASDAVDVDDVAMTAAVSSELDEYFTSYGSLEIHELMLKDVPRTLAYQKAIKWHAHDIRGKVVMDVGAGTGILSLFAAQCGAAKVIAVEASGMASAISKLAAINGFSDVIHVIQQRVEDIAVLPFGLRHVDVIVSEWMGFYCLHESMLQSVLVARDRWLQRDALGFTGLMLPSRAVILAAPSDMHQVKVEKINYFDKVFDLDFSPLKDTAKRNLSSKPFIGCIDSKELLCEPQIVREFDLVTCSIDDLSSFSAPLSFKAARGGELAGLTIWFDVIFGGGDLDKSPASSYPVLSTSPSADPTHWMQSTVFLGDWFPLPSGQSIGVLLTFQQDDVNPRLYKITVET